MNKKKEHGTYWCNECKIPIINKSSEHHICPKCNHKTNYMCTDARPVFPEERLFIEIMISKPLHFKNCSVWASKSGRYFIDGKSLLIPKNNYSFENSKKVREQIKKYSIQNSYDFFNKNISDFINANSIRLNCICDEAYNFIKKASNYLKNQNQFVSFSGGKDSTVCSSLVINALANPNIIHIFGDTTLEFDITYEYVDRFKKSHPLTVFKTVKNKEQNFFEVCKDIGPPAKKMRWCCTMFKTSPVSRLINTLYGNETVLSFNGIRACESHVRSKYSRLTIDPKSRKIQQQITASPIFNWMDLDVWNYILSNNIDFNYAYRLGYNRVGCWPCPNNSNRTSFLTHIYFPKQAQMWRNQLIEFSKSIGKLDAETYVDTLKWTARIGGYGVKAAQDIKLRQETCTTDEYTQVYTLKKPISEDFFILFTPLGKISKELGRKLVNEVLILDINTNIPIISIQSFDGLPNSLKVKIKTMNVKNHISLQRKIKYQITKYNACRACRKCESLCSFGAIKVKKDTYHIDDKKCKRCKKCISYEYIPGGCIMKLVLAVARKKDENAN